ncbi:Endochitinase 33 [Beauveria bassiana]|uniref:chitinase n=1 Tax=Beauveria bassiana TaxID=176275 RepID=A0A2N6NEA6_BEABA|nr:Endochitinase 33 [Beauveria bassiana]
MTRVNLYVGGFLATAATALAGFNPESGQNVAVYWGQNSASAGQERLAYYCNDASIDIINLAFITSITPVAIDFASATGKCTKTSINASLPLCREIEEDIKTCQEKGKSILISVGGGTSPSPNWGSASDAEKSAQLIWDMFGPVTSSKVDRPFGSAVVNGFDLDFEAPVSNLPAFGDKLRRLMDTATGKFYLSAAPQCVYPDANVGTTLDAVFFDIVQVQFYNNDCGVNHFQEGVQSQQAFNFPVWDEWAQKSKNPQVKVLIGIPANIDAAGKGSYTSGSKLQAALQWAKKYRSFGGVMMWDVAQLYANHGFSQEVVNDLNDSSQSRPNQTFTPTPATSSSLESSSSSVSRPSSVSSSSPSRGIAVPQWGQCGGHGYTGTAQCQAPYRCVSYSQWWSDCR